MTTARERFERWFKRHHPDAETMLRLYDGMRWDASEKEYVYALVQEAWRTYRAGFTAGRRGRRG